jgi:hypothetical protein
MGTSLVGLKPQFIVEFLNPPDKSGGNCLFIIQLELDEFDFISIFNEYYFSHNKKFNRDWL